MEFVKVSLYSTAINLFQNSDLDGRRSLRGYRIIVLLILSRANSSSS